MVRWLLKYRFFFLWLLFSAALASYGYYLFFDSPDKTALLPGITTDGHHQIEMKCDACHTNEKKKNVFTSSGVPNSACISCHGESLDKFADSHPVRKFKNPENIIFTQHIDALNCITCHREHNQKVTGEMAVTIPSDYCAHCHEVTLENLESHQDLEYDTCHTAGCHNYHDNTPLAPSYLVKHYGEDKLLENPQVPALASEGPCPDPWKADSSAASCASCHDQHFHDFTQGKHGMRLAFADLAPMTPGQARLPMKSEAAHRQLDCTACHQPDKPRSFAAVDSCLQCHDDSHSRNYQNSKHFALWQAAPEGRTGVSCATCHMPRIESDGGGYYVNHDNTANLTPNEKMIRSACAHCHGLQFTMNALTDRDLIQRNFSELPTTTHPGLEWAANAAIQRGDTRIQALRDYIQNTSKNTDTHHQKK